MSAFRKQRYQCVNCNHIMWSSQRTNQEGVIYGRCSVCNLQTQHTPCSTTQHVPYTNTYKEDPWKYGKVSR